jgi:hypothetical protein
MNHDKPILNLYLLDSKANRKDGVVDKRFPYDYVSVEQVAWYQQEAENDVVESLLFVHIPLMEYLEYEESENQEKIWPQGKNTGLFQAMLDAGTKTRGVFVGHDHLNNFDFLLEGVLLAYGQASGYNGYGILPKGARVIEYQFESKELQTYLLFDHEVVP